LERLGSDGLKDSVEGVVAGDAVSKLNVLFEPIVLRMSEVFDVVETLAAANHGAEGGEKDVGEGVLLGSIKTRVFHLMKKKQKGWISRIYKGLI